MAILAKLPKKSQSEITKSIPFKDGDFKAMYVALVEGVKKYAKSAADREVLDILLQVEPTEDEFKKFFSGSIADEATPLTFTDDQIEYIANNVYRNRDGKFRIIPSAKDYSPEFMPLEGLDADDDILSSKLMNVRQLSSGGEEEFDGLKALRKIPYDGEYDGIFKKLTPNLTRINIISSFEKDDPFGFFKRDGKMYRNICSQISTVDTKYVSDEHLRRAFLLMFLVSGGNLENWKTLYNIIHFMIRVPNSSMGYILYLNDFDTGGNGKSKLVKVLEYMFGNSFTSFSSQQLRFTASLMGKRLVYISEYEGNGDNKQLISILKSMTGRDKFQYEAKGCDPITADTYQNFVISSNGYIKFDDSGIKRRLQNFHCSQLLYILGNNYIKNDNYLCKFYGNMFNGESIDIVKGMANSLLDYILKDNNTYTINRREQPIVLGAVRNPILRALFATNMDCEKFTEEDGDNISIIYLQRLVDKAEPQEYNYASSTLQSWMDDCSFDISRDSTIIKVRMPIKELRKRIDSRLKELDNISHSLRSKTSVQFEDCTFNSFNSKELIDEFILSQTTNYDIPLTKIDNKWIVGK